MKRLPEVVPVRFRDSADVAAWLIDTWHRGFGDGCALADKLCKPLDSAGLVFLNDVDELLRALRSGAQNRYDNQKQGVGWLIQQKWTAHLSEFGQSREALLGSFGGVRKTDDEMARFHASCFGFTPNRENAEYAAFVKAHEVRCTEAPTCEARSAFPIGSRIRFTSKFLAATGQRGTDEARKVWTVQECTCSLCGEPPPSTHSRPRFVAVSERRDTPERLAEYAGDPEYQANLLRHPWRHIASGNLRGA